MSQESPMTVQQLQEQLMHQQAQIELQNRQLQELLQQPTPESLNQTEVQMSETPNLHDLPVRPTYDWTPSQELAALMPSRQHDIFLQVLDAKIRKNIVEQYPPMAGLKYTPSQRIPMAARRYNKAQLREDDNLQRIQYAISASLRPLDVLAHMLHPLLPAEDIERVYSTINDTRLLILNAAGVTNEQRSNLMLRVFNPDFQQPASDANYIMPVSTLQDTLTQQAALQKAMKDAQPKRQTPIRFPQSNPQMQNQQFFRAVPSLGGGGRDKYNQRRSNDSFKRNSNSKNPFLKNRQGQQQQNQ